MHNGFNTGVGTVSLLSNLSPKVDDLVWISVRKLLMNLHGHVSSLVLIAKK